MAAAFEFQFPDSAVRDACLLICKLAACAGGRALLVGGCVRDAALGTRVRDVDIEVFGVSPEDLERGLSAALPVDRVGRSFRVMKLRGLAVDVSVPRVHGTWDRRASPAAAAARRDFTVNAIAFDPLSEEIIDPLDGLSALSQRVLRHTSKQFGEDPLRVLRAMQLSSRFELEVAPETVLECRRLRGAPVARERVFGEWRKLMTQGRRPSIGLAFLRNCGWVSETPELAALIDCPQDPLWHPEGDVWIHTLHCVDAFAAERVGDDWEDLVVGLAVLCHDLGKPPTTAREEGRITSRGHERAGEDLTRTFLRRMTDERALASEVVPLVGAHLAPVALHQTSAGDAAIRRLARRVGRIDRLVRVARADMQGRPPLAADEFPAGDWLLERARQLEVAAAAPCPIVRGRHLIELGLDPGPEFAPILEACFDAQIEARFEDLEGGLEVARREIERRRSR